MASLTQNTQFRQRNPKQNGCGYVMDNSERPVCHFRTAVWITFPTAEHLPSAGVLLSRSSEVGPETAQTSTQ